MSPRAIERSRCHLAEARERLVNHLVCIGAAALQIAELKRGKQWPFHKHLDILGSSQQRSARQTYWR